jgi:hypothetical protein
MDSILVVLLCQRRAPRPQYGRRRKGIGGIVLNPRDYSIAKEGDEEALFHPALAPRCVDLRQQQRLQG